MAALAFALTVTGATAAAQPQDVEIDVNLSAEQLQFVNACHAAGYVTPNSYGDCINAVPTTGACDDSEDCVLYERWLAACGKTWSAFTDGAANLTDLGFYSEVCRHYQAGS